MASVGFGKRAISGQGPRRADDFAHLPRREASIASYIDRLPDGTCISIKALAEQLDYGQCALGTALRRLATEGHLRRFTERLEAGKHVTRTYFSRAPRSDAWWAAYQRGQDMDRWQEPQPRPEFVPEAESVPVPEAVVETVPRAERAYALLRRLGDHDHRLTLSAAECRALQPLVEEWLKRDLSGLHFTTQMVSGLPPEVGAPKRFVEKRIEMKMPPVREAPRRTPLLLECVVCRTPGPAKALKGGVCDGCYGGVEGAAPPVRAGSAAGDPVGTFAGVPVVKGGRAAPSGWAVAGGAAVPRGKAGPDRATGGGATGRTATAGGAIAGGAATGRAATRKAATGKAPTIKIASHLVAALPDEFLVNRACTDPDALNEEAMSRVSAYVRRQADGIREAMRERRSLPQ
ncbi:hypothetical protein AB0A77_09100 [Streptomyces varsoviensis]|uniref:hypothetical protein n=1 Tax=Streptomyces varsoviensis TaxID=67373 RepID=UPI0033FE34F8